jgi:hypothetical protein
MISIPQRFHGPISRSDTSRLRRLQGVGPRSGHSLTAKMSTIIPTPSHLAILRLADGNAPIARSIVRQNTSAVVLSVTVWRIAFSELRTARKP